VEIISRTTKLKQDFELTRTLTISMLKSRYRKTFAGFLWVILSPIITYFVQAIIFKNILKVNIENYYLFLLSGIIPWIFITSTLNMTVTSFIAYRALIMAFKVEFWVFILTQTIDNLITLAASFLILFFFVQDLSIFYYWKMPLFLLATFILSIGCFILSFLLATIHVFFRDTQFVLQFLLNMLYFITPIFYPKELIPENYHWIINFNPLYYFVKPFQDIMWNYDVELFFIDISKAIGLIILLVFIFKRYWKKKSNEIYFRI